MVLESTVICFDNSEFQRNGDYIPTRLIVQKDAVNMICLAKSRAHPENTMGLITIAGKREVLCTHTTDAMRITAMAQKLQPQGNIEPIAGIRVAHLVLKHRQNKNCKMRIVAFIGSPLLQQEDEFVALAKRLKKEKVSVDVISYGGYAANDTKLAAFMETLNGKSGTGSHLLKIPRGDNFTDALRNSAIVRGEDAEDGANAEAADFEFGIDPNVDPELALALRLSMEEEQRRQQNAQTSVGAVQENAVAQEPAVSTVEDVQMERYGSMDSIVAQISSASDVNWASDSFEMNSNYDDMPDFDDMTEEQQMAFALRMSMVEAIPPNIELENDLRNAMENLPGVDPESEEIRAALENVSKENNEEDKREPADAREDNKTEKKDEKKDKSNKN